MFSAATTSQSFTSNSHSNTSSTLPLQVSNMSIYMFSYETTLSHSADTSSKTKFQDLINKSSVVLSAIRKLANIRHFSQWFLSIDIRISFVQIGIFVKESLYMGKKVKGSSSSAGKRVPTQVTDFPSPPLSAVELKSPHLGEDSSAASLCRHHTLHSPATAYCSQRPPATAKRWKKCRN